MDLLGESSAEFGIHIDVSDSPCAFLAVAGQSDVSSQASQWTPRQVWNLANLSKIFNAALLPQKILQLITHGGTKARNRLTIYAVGWLLS